MSTPTTEPRKARWFDGTVNLPTIIAVITTLVSVAYYGITQVNDIKMRVARLEDHESNTSERITNLSNKQDADRVELKGQLTAINDKLDRLIWPQGYDRNPTRK